MHAHNISLRLKSSVAPKEFTELFEQSILPLLRKQHGFQDEVTCVGSDREVVSISLWDRKESAEDFSKTTYPEVLKTVSKLIEGTPSSREYETASRRGLTG